MTILVAALSGGCAAAPSGTGAGLGAARASFLTDDLLQVEIDLNGRPGPAELRARTDCEAAEAVLLRGDGFARHVRTTVVEEAGNSRVDAVYTVSAARPAGAFALDAKSVAAACREQGRSGV